MSRSFNLPSLPGLSEQEALRLALRGARVGSWVRDLRTDEVIWSPELEELFGLEPGTFDRQRATYLDLVHPEDVDRLRSDIERAVTSGSDYATEFRFRHASGEWRWMDGRGRAEYDATGRAVRLHGVGIDVTDRRRAEGARDWLAALVESATTAVIGMQLDGTITSWNAGAVRLFGYSALEMIGESIFRLVPPELHDEEHEALRRIRAGERISDFETVRLARDGRRRHVQLSVAPVRNARGEVVGASKISFSIDARVGAESRLREEAHALELLNRLGRSVAAELDLGRLVQLVTDAGTELTGARDGAFVANLVEAAGGTERPCTVSGSGDEDFARFARSFTAGLFAAARDEGALRAENAREDPRFAGYPGLTVRSALVVPVVSGRGEMLGALVFGHPAEGVFTDRAERIAAGIAAQAAIGIDNARLLREREALLESERGARAEAERLGHVKDEFLATLSHELRTPLNAIQGWSVLLRQPQLGPEDRERGLASIERNTRAQAQIINDLLDMSRIIAGKLHLEIGPMELADVITSAMEAVAPAAEARQVTLHATLDRELGRTRGDPNRLQQVMWNLLSNAVKFTPSDGEVRVTLERVGGEAQIRVQDSGIGISGEFLPFVFDRFRQADASTTRRYGGLGIGLSIVRNLVELHGGTVRAESAGEGQGSCFLITLPLSRAAAEQRRAPQAPAGGAAGRPQPERPPLPRLDGARILIVDDEGDTRELLGKIILDSGGTPVGVASADAALALLEGGVDLLVSDIGMPGTDGYSLIRRLREREAQLGRRAIPAIAATAYVRSEDRERSLLAGYQLHLAKPVEPRELIAAIASLLRLTAVG